MLKIKNYKRQFSVRPAKGYSRAYHDLSVSSENEQFVIRREFPGKGFHHFLNRKDVQTFIQMLPEWNSIIRGLDYVLLARGERGCDGWYDGKVVAISAWEQDKWRSVPADYYEDHSHVIARLGVETVKCGPYYLCKFNPDSIRAFQLLHVFLHELGHHFDKITTRSQRVASRGEGFAESYACSHEDLVWQRYAERFEL